MAVFRQKMTRIMAGEFKCKHCGYDKYLGALEFHHKDPSQKERMIGRMRNYSEVRLRAEVEKCIVLCSNCHREEHDRLRRL